MQQIHPENWTIIYFGLIFVVACVQMAIAYTLSNASNPMPGLGLYTVYFMATLLGLIAFALQYSSSAPMRMDIFSTASIIYSYLLFAAAGQRAQIKRGRIVLGIICLATCISVFFLEPQDIFGVQMSTTTLFFACAGLLCGWRSWAHRNIGDAITAAALMTIVGTLIGIYVWQIDGDSGQVQTAGFGLYSSAYVLVAIGFLTSVLIENQQRLSHISTQDPLTMLLNRHGLEQTLHVTLAQAARQQLPTSAIMVDIDHFKEINDNFGNKAGDQVLKQVSDTLQRISRASDLVARVGGEEYLLILPSTDLEDARTLAERIRIDIAESALLINRQQIAITASLGVAGALGAIELNKLSSEAERALHLAKRGGRNQVASVENKPILLSTHVNQA
ncbi:MAG: GGDEF domain-containing protein [Halioglobus sp.]|nr:GGDEF domain-containing protein [Halioglobus sp.]